MRENRWKELLKLYSHFHLERPKPDTSFDVATKTELLFLNHFKRFEEVLLKEHHVHLYNKFAVGYEVLRASEQTSRAEEESIRNIRREMHKLGQRLYNVDIVKLSDRERQFNADALGRLGQMVGMTKNFKRHQDKQMS